MARGRGRGQAGRGGAGGCGRGRGRGRGVTNQAGRGVSGPGASIGRGRGTGVGHGAGVGRGTGVGHGAGVDTGAPAGHGTGLGRGERLAARTQAHEARAAAQAQARAAREAEIRQEEGIPDLKEDSEAHMREFEADIYDDPPPVQEYVVEEAEEVKGDRGAPVNTSGLLRAMEEVMRNIARNTRGEAQGGRETQYSAAQLHFRRMDPPTFLGTEEPVEADLWLSAVEGIFDSLNMFEDELRMATAPFYLRGEAAEWWKGKKQIVGTTRWTWEGFRRAFLAEFFPATMRERKRAEFTNLTQQLMSVQQYQRRFTSLSRYAPEMVATEELRIQRFKNGLRHSIRGIVVSNLHDTYEKSVSTAMKGEESQQDRQRVVDARS